jgi:hypothetical protein
MPDSDGGEMNCAKIQSELRKARALTAAESAHMENCDTCVEAWLEATVTQALNEKPEVQIPADFAARVAARVPAQRKASPAPRVRPHNWGLLTAILLIAAGLIATAFADPGALNTRMGAVFILLVASEIAGIALWLGTDWPSRHTASRGSSRWSRT